MKKLWIMVALLAVMMFVMPAMATTTTSYPDQAISGGYPAGHFDDVYDLTTGDIVLTATYDGTGMVDDFGGNAHAWAELGVRSLGSSADFNPDWRDTYVYGTKIVDLLTDKNIRVGEVEVSGNGQNLYVTYRITEAGWAMKKTHLAVEDAIGSIPQTKKGDPKPNKFEFSTHHKPAATEYTYEVDTTQSSPTTTLYIAAEAELVQMADGHKDGKGKSWADGDDFSGKKWATYFTYKPTVVPVAGSGVWLATDYEWIANTFDPDPVGGPTLDLDDKLILQRMGGQGEGAYDMPSVPTVPGNNHRIWWDRDGVDPWQNPATANTGGIYPVIITLHATSDTTGTAYMNIRELDQGFETDSNWNTIELTPAGMTFTGDMKHLQVFYGLYGYGTTHSATFSDITVTQ